MSFNGVAKSVRFGGALNQQVFDDLTFGTAIPRGGPVPAPGSLAMIGASLAGLAVSHRRKTR